MKVLVVMVRHQTIDVSWFDGMKVRLDGQSLPYDGDPESVGRVVHERVSSDESRAVDAIVMRARYGGVRFRDLTVWNEATDRALEQIAPEAPLPVGITRAQAASLQAAFPDLPVWLAFETSFFADLPEREALYGLDPVFMTEHRIRRTGFHGWYHRAAVHAARSTARRERSRTWSRILSICLEPRPELAAIRDGRPVMVTGGMTPFEGLPGESSCGDLDPSILLKVVDSGRLGPEQLNQVAGEEGGLQALAGAPVTLEAVIRCDHAGLELAHTVWMERLIRAVGAGIAAMGGLDGVVFSGRYAGAGRWLEIGLRERLGQALEPGVMWGVSYFSERLDAVLAEPAILKLMACGPVPERT